MEGAEDQDAGETVWDAVSVGWEGGLIKEPHPRSTSGWAFPARSTESSPQAPTPGSWAELWVTCGRRKAQDAYLVLVGLGGQPLVQGRDFGGQVLEALPQHFFLREEGHHTCGAARLRRVLARAPHHHWLPWGGQEARCRPLRGAWCRVCQVGDTEAQQEKLLPAVLTAELLSGPAAQTTQRRRLLPSAHALG